MINQLLADITDIEDKIVTIAIRKRHGVFFNFNDVFEGFKTKKSFEKCLRDYYKNPIGHIYYEHIFDVKAIGWLLNRHFKTIQKYALRGKLNSCKNKKNEYRFSLFDVGNYLNYKIEQVETKMILEDQIRDTLISLVKAKEAFTSLNITNHIKKTNANIHHREVSPIVKKLMSYEFPDYNQKTIPVKAEVLEGTVLVVHDTVAVLYYPDGYDINNYTTRELRVQQNRYDFNSTTYANDIFSSQKIPFVDTVDITHFNQEKMDFNVELTGDSVIFNKVKKGYMTIENGQLDLSIVKISKISNLPEIWMHYFNDKIIINGVHGIAMDWAISYTGKTISFKVDTPDSKEKEMVQTVLLNVEGTRCTKEGNFLVFGHNWKRVKDDAENEDVAARHYRLDRVYKDSVKVMNF